MAIDNNLSQKLNSYNNYSGDIFEKMSNDNSDDLQEINELQKSNYIKMSYGAFLFLQGKIEDAIKKDIKPINSAKIVLINDTAGFDKKPLDTMVSYKESSKEDVNNYMRSFEFEVYKVFLFLRDASPSFYGFDVANVDSIEIPLSLDKFRDSFFSIMLNESLRSELEKNLMELDLSPAKSNSNRAKNKL